MAGIKFQEFLEDLKDVVLDEKTKKRFRTLGKEYFLIIAGELSSAGYSDVDYYFSEGQSIMAGDHVLIATNPRTHKGIYLSIGLYFNPERKMLVRGIRPDRLQTPNRSLKLIDFCKKETLIKGIQLIIEKDCGPEFRAEI